MAPIPRDGGCTSLNPARSVRRRASSCAEPVAEIMRATSVTVSERHRTNVFIQVLLQVIMRTLNSAVDLDQSGPSFLAAIAVQECTHRRRLSERCAIARERQIDVLPLAMLEEVGIAYVLVGL